MFSFLPTTDRCCGCTRNLKVACVLIAMCHILYSYVIIRLMFYPNCPTQYEPAGGPAHQVLYVFKWIYFVTKMIDLTSCFAYLFGIFFSYPITADIFILCSLICNIVGFIFAVTVSVQMVAARCGNPSDVLSIIIFLVIWGYFVIIVNSYRDFMVTNEDDT